MSAQVVRLRSGDTISVRTGVLRGAGPQGPMGPPGATGPKGEQGLQGPPGTVNDIRTRLRSTATVPVADDQWYDLPLDEVVTNEVLVDTDPVALQFKEPGLYLTTIRVTFELADTIPPSASGTRSLRLADQSGETVTNISVAAASNEDTVVELVAVVNPNTSYRYRLQAKANDEAGVGVRVTSRTLTFLRVGSGPVGPPGPKGPVGNTGPQGPRGLPGEAAEGFSTLDAVMGGADSTQDPGGEMATAGDQEMPVPAGTQPPAIPYFLRAIASWLERRLVARFPNAAARDARTSPQPGEVTYLEDTGVPYLREKSGVNQMIARVVVTTAAPPTGAGQAAPGTIWLQV